MAFIAAVNLATREPFIRRHVKNLKASYLLYADVPQWDTLALAQPLHSLPELQTAIAQVARKKGIDTAQNFPFLMIAKIKSGEGETAFRDEAHKTSAMMESTSFPFKTNGHK